MAARLERTVLPTAAEEFTLKRWAAHGYETDADALGDTGDWSRAVVDVTKHQGLA